MRVPDVDHTVTSRSCYRLPVQCWVLGPGSQEQLQGASVKSTGDEYGRLGGAQKVHTLYARVRRMCAFAS